MPTNNETQVPFDELSSIIDWENGSLSHEKTLELFQHLVNTGRAWTLQGCYGREAAHLLKSGQIEARTETARRVKGGAS